MRIVRFRPQRGTATGEEPVAGHGLVEGDVLHQVSDPFKGKTPRLTGRTLPLDSVRLLAPTEPRLVIGMARNGEPDDRRFPPNAFLKPPGSVIGPGDPIPLPGHVGRVDAEGELAVVIGRTARNLAVGDALDAVLGYTLGNDVTARDLQAGDPLQAKGYDGFTPLGPWIETDLDAGAVDLAVSIGGRSLPVGSTARLARGVSEILAYLTSFLTLHPGDVVLAGAPGTYGPVAAGETVAISAPGLGVLTNPVVAAPAAPRTPERTR
ncbi:MULTISPECIES: fumarylacetoacetate hydrolase family protein [unclassified Streptomyces]|uniref:fumarylacetoacetate hydrolase family protein n=1 Tax=unclassified Streptomyces TaxID=2593676 RepID=UPI0027415D9D|nr:MULTISPECIES: fumarylacetoacetate hydrolase family protein [unclassified Streptomyces]